MSIFRETLRLTSLREAMMIDQDTEIIRKSF